MGEGQAEQGHVTAKAKADPSEKESGGGRGIRRKERSQRYLEGGADGRQLYIRGRGASGAALPSFLPDRLQSLELATATFRRDLAYDVYQTRVNRDFNLPRCSVKSALRRAIGGDYWVFSYYGRKLGTKE